jgi:hypothetical protein
MSTGIPGPQGAPGIQGPAGGATVAKLAADTAAITATALADVAGLSVALAAGILYRVEALVPFTSASVLAGVKLGVTHPSATLAVFNVAVPVAADGVAAMLHGWVTSSGDSVAGTGVQANNATYLAGSTASSSRRRPGRCRCRPARRSP